LVEKFGTDYEALNRKHLGAQLDKLQLELSQEIASYTQGREVRLRNAPAVLKPVPHAVEIQVSDSVIETPVGLQGHGFQRTLLLAALTVLSKRNRRESSGDMFLAIEEPELFQHPTQAKAFASVLRHLAAEPEQQTQVVYATHSPHFVDPRYFDQVRRISSRRVVDAPCASSQLKVASMDAVSSRLKGFVPAPSIERRWDQVCLKYLPDALFAESAILVEGDEDAAILEGMGNRINELAVSGICVAPVQGKSNMLIPFAILELLEIPALMVVDNDSGAPHRMRNNRRSEEDICRVAQKNRSDNRMFCRFVGGTESDYPVGAVTKTLAFVPDTMESLLANDLPGWDLTRQRVIEDGRGVEGKNAATYGLAARECCDAPGAQLREILKFCTSKVA
jgi:putative ATP-dependent endonuclease of the OLD family